LGILGFADFVLLPLSRIDPLAEAWQVIEARNPDALAAGLTRWVIAAAILFAAALIVCVVGWLRGWGQRWRIGGVVHLVFLAGLLMDWVRGTFTWALAEAMLSEPHRSADPSQFAGLSHLLTAVGLITFFCVPVYWLVVLIRFLAQNWPKRRP